MQTQSSNSHNEKPKPKPSKQTIVGLSFGKVTGTFLSNAVVTESVILC